MKTYNQTSSFNTQFARDYGIVAALVYDELSFWGNKSINDGWIYKSYEDMQERLPVSEYQLRMAYKILIDHGYIEVKIAKITTGETRLHFRILRNLSFRTEKTEVPIGTEETKVPLLTATKTATKNKQKESELYKDLLQSLIVIINPKEKPTQDRLRLLNGRLKDYKPVEIVAAAKELAKSEWHRENKQMSVDNLLAPSKFGRWYAKSQDSTPEKKVIF